MRSSTWDLSCLARKQDGVLVLRRSHDAIPICHVADFIHTMCYQNSKLAAWEVASCAKLDGGNPVAGRSKISVICNVHTGAMSSEGVAHRPRPSIPSPQKRTVERHLDVPCASVTCFERHVEQIVAVLGRCQEQPGTRTQHRTQGQFADLPIYFRL